MFCHYTDSVPKSQNVLINHLHWDIYIKTLGWDHFHFHRRQFSMFLEVPKNLFWEDDSNEEIWSENHDHVIKFWGGVWYSVLSGKLGYDFQTMKTWNNFQWSLRSIEMLM